MKHFSVLLVDDEAELAYTLAERLVLRGVDAVAVHVNAVAETQAPAPADTQPTFTAHVPIRAITQGPKGHWFAYYDKIQFDETNHYVLAMEVDFQDRTPTPDDVIKLGMVDIEGSDQWIPFAESRAWSWQQGCMLQWLPGSKKQVIYNDRDGDHYISVIQDVFTGEKRVLPKAIYAVSPTGKLAVGTNFARIDDTRPGYGYKGVVDPGADDLHPDNDGLYVLNLETGESKLLFSYDQIAAIPQDMETPGKHWFNHLLFNTDGTRFIFLHRAYKKGIKEGGWATRMFTAAPDGAGLYCVADHGMVSHFIWKNPKQILAWSTEPQPGNRFHLYDDQTDKVEVIGDGILTHDGHCTYSPGGQWILTDGYPSKERMQPLMLFRPADSKLVVIGAFYLPPEHKGEFRCDLHPRWSRNGKYITIDSMHEGDVRQVYLLDVSEIVGPGE